MNEFAKTLEAIKEVEREETGGQCASDSAYWAVADALTEECGSDPIWDVVDDPFEFKGGNKLRDAQEWLVDHGVEGYYSALQSLYESRDMGERFPPHTRSMRATYLGHMQCEGPDELRHFEAHSEPDQTLVLFSDFDGAAHDKYGPG